MSAGKLPPELLTSFKEAWLKDFGEDISDELANEYGVGVLDLVMTLAGHPAMIKSTPKRLQKPTK